MNKRISWNDYFMEIALLISKRTTCLRRAVGAVLVKDNKILATGYNGAPKGIKHCKDRKCIRKQMNVPSGQNHELCFGLHAEMNAIIQAATSGVNTIGATLYCTTFPCVMCTKMLINSGIKTIYYKEFYKDELSINLLIEANINFIEWEGK